MADAFETDFKQRFDLFRFFRHFYSELIISSFSKQGVLHVNVDFSILEALLARGVFDVLGMLGLVIQHCGFPMSEAVKFYFYLLGFEVWWQAVFDRVDEPRSIRNHIRT